MGKNPAKRGRPSSSGSLQDQLELKKRKNPSAIVPPLDVRKDSLDHWPEWVTNRGRCKNPLCKNLSYVFCSKCKLHLCFNQKNHCFRTFHEK